MIKFLFQRTNQTLTRAHKYFLLVSVATTRSTNKTPEKRKKFLWKILIGVLVVIFVALIITFILLCYWKRVLCFRRDVAPGHRRQSSRRGLIKTQTTHQPVKGILTKTNNLSKFSQKLKFWNSSIRKCVKGVVSKAQAVLDTNEVLDLNFQHMKYLRCRFKL